MKRPSQAAHGISATPLPINIMLCCVVATVQCARISPSPYSNNFEVTVGSDRRGTVYRSLWLGEALIRVVCVHIVEGVRDHND